MSEESGGRDRRPRESRHTAGEPPEETFTGDPSGLIVGVSRAFGRLVDEITLVGSSEATVLLCGETGTGKGLCARSIHAASARAAGPFVAVNCGMSPELIENELFGHEPGAFTGATGRRRGLVDRAEKGTLFLDELHALAPPTQVKLLRLLEEKEYRPLGSQETREADIRLIAATNEDVLRAVRAGRIRRDFYFRLSVLTLTIPPLRERHQDILPLAWHFLRAHGLTRVLSSGASGKLLRHDWPGNVRELKHVIEGAVIRAGHEVVITEREIQFPATRLLDLRSQEPFAAAKARAVAEFERSYIERMLSRHGGNVSRAARAAGMSRRTLQRLSRSHAIDLETFRDGAPRCPSF